MNLENAADCLAELGHPTRLSIYRLLVKTGNQGMTVGEIGRQLEIAPTTLNHHIEHLRRTDLIQKVKDGRMVWCKANYQVMDHLIEYLSEDCCVGE